MFLNLKYALQYITRNKALSAATTIVILVTFILINSLIIAQVIIDKTASYLNKQQKISILYEPETTKEDILKFKSELETMPGVKKVVYKDSKELQRDNLRSLGLSDDEVNSIVTSQEDYIKILQIELKPDSDQEVVVDTIKKAKQEGAPIISFVYFKNLIERIKSISNGLRISGFIVTGALIIISIQLIYLTISFTVTKMNNEIKTMYLVGASKSKITTPFAIQGAIYGLIAAFLAYISFIVILFLVKITLHDNVFVQTIKELLSSIGVTAFLEQKTLIIILGIETAVGLILGYAFAYMAANNTIKQLNYD